MEDLFSLAGKTFLVTGGTRGIGRAISLRFARAGAAVIANYVRDAAAADQLEADAEAEGLKLETCRADLTSPKGLDRIRERISEGPMVIDGLVHCAATGVHKPIMDCTERHFQWTFSLNAFAFLEVFKLLAPHFDAGSTVVALSSMGAVFAVPNYALIGASKGALESLARSMAAEYAGRNLRINIIRPGSVMTDVWKIIPEGEKRLQETRRRTPLGRLVTADEVAHVAQFLCSPASAGIVGQTIVIDGGKSITE